MSRRISIFLLSFVMLVSLEGCRPKFWRPYPPSYDAMGKPLAEVKGIKKIARVSDILYRGDQPSREGFQHLKNMGIKTVVTLRAMHSQAYKMKGTGLRYVWISYKVWHSEDEDVVAFLKVVQNPENQPVFVHCTLGADRTGLMVAMYRILEEGWTKEQAIAEMKEYGFAPFLGNMMSYIRKVDVEKIRQKLATAPEPKVRVVQ